MIVVWLDIYLIIIIVLDVLESRGNYLIECPLVFIILRHILKKMKAKSSTQMSRFLTRCLQIELALSAPTSVVHVSECQFFFIKF